MKPTYLAHYFVETYVSHSAYAKYASLEASISPRIASKSDGFNNEEDI